ncbi:hypothetical protein, partial [Saccharothrix xinjiangensis]
TDTPTPLPRRLRLDNHIGTPPTTTGSRRSKFRQILRNFSLVMERPQGQSDTTVKIDKRGSSRASNCGFVIFEPIPCRRSTRSSAGEEEDRVEGKSRTSGASTLARQICFG